MSKPALPFAALFKYVSPKDFISLFNLEIPQTAAFLLSFSPSKRYVKKVLCLLDHKERALYPDDDTRVLEKRTSFIIREYLQRCRDESCDRVFIQKIEQEVNRMISGYEDLSDFRKMRKRLFFKHPKLLRGAGKNKDSELKKQKEGI
jgi:hypothetical protein